MFHLSACFVAIANVADTPVPALADDVIRISNGRFTPAEKFRLVQGYSSAVTLLRTQIDAPSLRKISNPFIFPVGTTLLPVTDPNYADYWDNPLQLQNDEGINILSTDSAAGPNNHYVGLWLQRDYRPAPRGDTYTLRGTHATTVTASAWSTVTVTWGPDLPVGEYAVVGGQAISTTGIFFSLIFPGYDLRPGGLCGADAGVRPPWRQLKGASGEWGRFRNDNPPQVRFLCNAADTSGIILLDVVRVN